MYYNTATFRHSYWPLHEAARAPPSVNAYLTVSSFPSFLQFFFSLCFSDHTFPFLYSPTSNPFTMCKKHKDELIHVHPPFPSFAWVMTAQANPPTQAYAYGYIRNAQIPQPRLLAHRATPPGRHRRYACSSRSPPPPAQAKIEPCDEKFMVGPSTMDFFVACGGRKLNTYPYVLENGRLSLPR
jgi:hypothetical protein